MKLTDSQITDILKKNKEKSSENDISLDEIERFGDVASITEMFGDIRNYRRMLNERITFVNEELTNMIPFTRENLYLICAHSGHGKSTIAANVSHPLWKQKKKVLVISNEEPKQDVLFRIACLELGYDFNAYKKGFMQQPQIKECLVLFPQIAEYVKVIDVTFKNGFTTRIEGVKKALENCKDKDYSCILIDYYQLIRYSDAYTGTDAYTPLNDLRIWLGRYIKTSNAPVVLFAQLHSVAKRQNKGLDSRIKECPAVIEPSTVIIEVVPNFQEKTSQFIVHKDRFGYEGRFIKFGFHQGKYVSLTEEFRKKIKEEQLNKNLELLGLNTNEADDE